MATSPVDQQLPASSPCAFVEIIQHICEGKPSKIPGQWPALDCFPLPRILKICQGQPAIEITKEVDISRLGHIQIPSTSQESSIVGRPWRSVKRRDVAEVEREEGEEAARLLGLLPPQPERKA